MEPMTIIDDEEMVRITNAKRLWEMLSYPEYDSEDGGFDNLMKRGTLYYATHGETFAGEAFLLKNFRSANLIARDVRRARVKAKEIPEGQTALGEYQEAYRNYINCRHKNRREDEILARKLVSPPQPEQSKEHQGAIPSKTDKVFLAKIYKKGTWKWLNDGWAQLHADGDPWRNMGKEGGAFLCSWSPTVHTAGGRGSEDSSTEVWMSTSVEEPDTWDAG